METPVNRSEVNVRQLINDLVGMYTEDTVDVVISELVANALDAKAANINIAWAPEAQVLTIEDDGDGMGPEDFKRYHNFAEELKLKGDGIGFAGLGAKLSFDVADRVVTITQNRGETLGSDWRWAGDDGLEWENLEDAQLGHDGTKVQVHIRDRSVAQPLSAEHIGEVLHRAYLPLFIDEFVERYARNGIYPQRPTFRVNGDVVHRANAEALFSFEDHDGGPVARGKSHLGVRVIGTQSDEGSRFGLPFGLLLCTYGKAVKVDMLDVSPGSIGDRLFGIYEIPELAKFLTSNKSGFRDKPGKGRPLGKILDLVRNDLRDYLESQGVSVSDPQRGQLSAKLERELSRLTPVLPELSEFQAIRSRQAALQTNPGGAISVEPEARRNGSERSGDDDPDQSENECTHAATNPDGKKPARKRPRRRQGPQVAFAQQPERQAISWLDDDIITINAGHPAYETKQTTNSSRMTYCMFAIALAIAQSGLVEPDERDHYVEHFMRAWGGP